MTENSKPESTFDRDAAELVFDYLKKLGIEVDDKGIGEIYLIERHGPFNNRAEGLRYMLHRNGVLHNSI